MQTSNVYRFFAAKSKINEAVCLDLRGRIEAEAEKIAASRVTAGQRMRNVIGSVETTHAQHPGSLPPRAWGNMPRRPDLFQCGSDWNPSPDLSLKLTLEICDRNRDIF
jgi:hypothetical protein